MTAVTSIIGALALASTLVGCSAGGNAEGVPVAGDARFMVIRAGDGPESVADLDAWRALLADGLVLPASLPAGLELAAAEVRLPAPRANAATGTTEALVTVAFQRKPGDGFVVAYRRAPVDSDPPRVAAATAVVVTGATSGQVAEHPAPTGGLDLAVTSLWFRACGLDVQLTAVGSDLMPRQEVLALARAFIEGCE